MITNIHNENFGYAVAVSDNWSAVGNPSLLRYTQSSAICQTGSVNVYKYNINTDTHIEKGVIYRPLYSYEISFLTTEANNAGITGPNYVLHTESPGNVVSTSNSDIMYDIGLYYTASEDSYGKSLDIYNNILAVGNPYFTSYITTYAVTIPFTGSGTVDLFNLKAYDSQNAPFVLSIPNPTPTVTSSFGYDVSINKEWLAISSIYDSGNKGAVYMYRNTIGAPASWSFYQTLGIPSNINAGDAFGYSLDLNKQTGSYSGSMVVGSLKPTGSNAYVYEFDGTNWNLTFTLTPDNTTIQPLTFFPSNVLVTGSYQNNVDSFGHDVAIFMDTVVVGAPTDRLFFEYSGSSVYRQGAVYFFERCGNRNRGYYLANKSYGNEKTQKNNLLGNSVSIYDTYAVVSCPNVDLDVFSWQPINSICFLRGSIYQQNYTDIEPINGQFVLYQKNTGSIPDTTNFEWDIVNVYQTKKRFLSPFRTYGYSVDICENFINIGSPMFISGSNRIMDFSPGSSSFTGSVNDVGDLFGKSYIYNLNNLKPNYYIGNVFYRNGKIVLMTSGSMFDEILTTDLAEAEYEIDFQSKQVIYEKQIVCSVEPGEFNVSTNPTAVVQNITPYDINKNGIFDFQDVDILLRYMKYKETEENIIPTTDWTSSIISTVTDEEITVYNSYSASWQQTDNLYSQSYNYIDTTLYSALDLNQDNKIDVSDMNILWKYFTYRLTQKNYDSYITSNSDKKYLSDIIDYLNSQTQRGYAPSINSNFLDYVTLTKADPTGSYLAPYATSIGLYNGTDLVAIAKLGSPIKITPDFPINFIVKMDF